MQLRVLGARQGESRDSHFGCLLVDGTLALDAGGLTASLTLDEQLALAAILVTHRHFDHVKDLATLGFNLFVRHRQIPVYCADDVRESLEATLLNPRIWIDFFVEPADVPTFRHVPISAGCALDLEGKRARLIPVPHSVPTLGVELTASDGRCLLYTADNGPGAAASWTRSRPDLLVTETTYPSAQTTAAEHGHLTPRMLAAELAEFRRAQGYLPRVLVVHVNPFSLDGVAAEVADVAADLGADVRIAEEGGIYEV